MCARLESKGKKVLNTLSRLPGIGQDPVVNANREIALQLFCSVSYETDSPWSKVPYLRYLCSSIFLEAVGQGEKAPHVAYDITFSFWFPLRLFLDVSSHTFLS